MTAPADLQFESDLAFVKKFISFVVIVNDSAIDSGFRVQNL